MPGTNTLFFQMNECTRKLDESLEEGMIFVLALQPQVLKHIMRFIVFLGVEADEICEVARIKSLRRETEGFHIGFDPLGLVDWLRGHPQTIDPYREARSTVFLRAFSPARKAFECYAAARNFPYTRASASPEDRRELSRGGTLFVIPAMAVTMAPSPISMCPLTPTFPASVT